MKKLILIFFLIFISILSFSQGDANYRRLSADDILTKEKLIIKDGADTSLYWDQDTNTLIINDTTRFKYWPMIPSGTPPNDSSIASKKWVLDEITAGGGYTDNDATDAIGAILNDDEIEWTYVANTSITGKLDIVGRTLETGIAATDIIMYYDATATANRNISFASFESRLSHGNLANTGSNTHAQIDTHISNSALHFTEGSIDHTAITGIGTNSHVDIDNHIGTSNIHYLQSGITETGVLTSGEIGIGFTQIAKDRLDTIWAFTQYDWDTLSANALDLEEDDFNPAGDWDYSGTFTLSGLSESLQAKQLYRSPTGVISYGDTTQNYWWYTPPLAAGLGIFSHIIQIIDSMALDPVRVSIGAGNNFGDVTAPLTVAGQTKSTEFNAFPAEATVNVGGFAGFKMDDNEFIHSRGAQINNYGFSVGFESLNGELYNGGTGQMNIGSRSSNYIRGSYIENVGTYSLNGGSLAGLISGHFIQTYGSGNLNIPYNDDINDTIHLLNIQNYGQNNLFALSDSTNNILTVGQGLLNFCDTSWFNKGVKNLTLFGIRGHNWDATAYIPEEPRSFAKSLELPGMMVIQYDPDSAISYVNFNVDQFRLNNVATSLVSPWTTNTDTIYTLKNVLIGQSALTGTEKFGVTGNSYFTGNVYIDGVLTGSNIINPEDTTGHTNQMLYVEPSGGLNWTDGLEWDVLLETFTIDAAIVNPIGSIADNDLTPDVSGNNVFLYAGTTTAVAQITDLDNAVIGATYTFIGNSESYILQFNDSGYFNLNGGMSLGADDVITIMCIGTRQFIEKSRSNN